jgi:4-hydroxybenzoate polyprenyltransferase
LQRRNNHGNNPFMSEHPPLDRPVADAVPRHWADRLLPKPLRPYARLARLERPIGWWLLLLPGWWAVILAQVPQGGLPDIGALALFLAGAILMRGAGCTFNDIVDRRLDAAVERTRLRPIASGQVATGQAVAFLGAQLIAALLILLQFNPLTIALGAASLALVAIYPFMKRITHWPQLFLGLAFNWGALLGWAAIGGSLPAAAIALYVGGIFWTLAYDTIYAHQDKEDDILIGVKSTALKLGSATRQWLVFFFAAALAMIALAGWLAGAGPAFLAGVVAAAVHAGWQVRHLDTDDPGNCLAVFRSNRDFGLLILAGSLAACLSGGSAHG